MQDFFCMHTLHKSIRTVLMVTIFIDHVFVQFWPISGCFCNVTEYQTNLFQDFQDALLTLCL